MGLFTLQHRGQDAAGILSYEEGDGPGFHLWKDNGLVENVFSEKVVESLKGSVAMGHTRYSTVGRSDNRIDVQPFVLNYPHGIGMAHNGNVVNHAELAEKLKRERRRIQFSNNDLEVIQNLFADTLADVTQLAPRVDFSQMQQAVRRVFSEAIGGYSVVGILAGHGLFAFRDPQGIRPLCLGVREGQDGKKFYCVASEQIVLSFLGYENMGDVAPGELVYVEQNGTLHRKVIDQAPQPRPCMFEWVYFAGAESSPGGRPVYGTRLRLGVGLAQRVREMMNRGEMAPDIIVPVPETARISAIAMAEELKVPYREVLIKNRYIHRSFILNTQEKRTKAVDLKLNPVKSEIEGKNVLLVDDSIVRGTTSRRLVDLVRKAGAKEVYFASTCPPIQHPCFYGIDFPNPEELIATGRNNAQIAEALGANKVIYLEQNALEAAIGLKTLCMACLDGKYPTDVSSGTAFREKRSSERSNAT